MSATYNLNILIKACGEFNQVVVLNKAENCAREDFGLNTKKAVLEFIYNDGLEHPRHINTKPWEQNPDSSLIMIDAYSFYSGSKQGYIAFFFSTKTNKWLIKSFKLNKDNVPPNNNMANQLSSFKALTITEEK